MDYFLILLAICFNFGYGVEQPVSVAGKIFCTTINHGSMEAAGAFIQLFEYDREGYDDLLSTTTADNHGEYLINGTESEYWTVEPYLVVSAKCIDIRFKSVSNDLAKRCAFVIKENVPQNGESFSQSGLSLNIDTATADIVCS